MKRSKVPGKFPGESWYVDQIRSNWRQTHEIGQNGWLRVRAERVGAAEHETQLEAVRVGQKLLPLDYERSLRKRK